LINRQVAVIVGHSAAAMAAKTATTTIPIVGVVGDDPVRTGLVANLNRPGGNVTGVSFGTIDVSGKRLRLLRELVPQSNVLAALLDINLVEFDQKLRALEAASKTMGRRLVMVRVANAPDLDAFTTIFNLARSHCMWEAVLFSLLSYNAWCCFRRAMQFRPATRIVSLSLPVGSCLMDRAN
jgi:putative ABC transport system substrate-binding protein